MRQPLPAGLVRRAPGSSAEGRDRKENVGAGDRCLGDCGASERREEPWAFSRRQSGERGTWKVGQRGDDEFQMKKVQVACGHNGSSLVHQGIQAQALDILGLSVKEAWRRFSGNSIHGRKEKDPWHRPRHTALEAS